MKTSSAILASFALPAALATPIDYTPKGGWSSIDWTKITYPKGTGENLPYYPPPPGGWESVDYTDGSGKGGSSVGGGSNPSSPPSCPPSPANSPLTFTSTHLIPATPEQVVNGTTPTGGLSGAKGTFALGLNSDLNLICYNITLENFRGDYQSPARTATHIHEAAKGASGPPRIAFPNPTEVEGRPGVRRSVGCLMGPFLTGVNGTDGRDSGTGFQVRRIEEAPQEFFADVHSSEAVPGAVRGQVA